MKNKIITYISFIAVVISIMPILLTTISQKNDLKFTSLLIGLFASLIGALLVVLYKKLTTQKFKGKIYISYAENDKKYADFIRNRLINRNFLLNLDESNIPVGENIRSVIENELNSANIFIVLLSKNSEKSKWVNYEIETALKNGKKILPVLIEENVKIPEKLQNIKYADFSKDKYRALDAIIESLKNNLEKE